MYCSNCGAKCQDGTRFCTKCGKKLANDEGQKTEYSANHVPEQMEVARDIASGNNHESLAGKSPLKIRFPVAGIFFAIHGMFFLYYSTHMYSDPTRPFVGIAYFTWQTWLSLFLLFACAILLFLRRMKPFSIVLLVYCIRNTINYIVIALQSIPDDMQNYYPRAFLSVLFDILAESAMAVSYGLLAVLALTVLMKENRFSTIARKLWYIPGALFCLINMLALLRGGIPYSGTFIVIADIVCSIAEIILSGWWLTHPYKEQRISQYTHQAAETRSHNGETIELETNPNNNPGDIPSFGYAVLGFFVPMAGLILYLVWREETPLRAKSAGKGALVGVIVWVGLSVIMAILSVLLPMMALKGYY